MLCSSCPRKCGRERPGGFCGMPEKARVARAALHYFEEPVISGKNGSGTVFFCGCNLRCIFCQNREISRGGFEGFAEYDAEGLRRIFAGLRGAGAHNINLVTPSHYTDIISEALNESPGIPVVYNSGGYDDTQSLKGLNGKINIYLPDLKYISPSLAATLSGAENYPTVAMAALDEMYRQVGKCRYSADGMLEGGMIIRHLVLPGHIENTIEVLDYIYDSFPRSSVLVSLMGQYTPPTSAAFAERYPTLASPLTAEEYEIVKAHFQKRRLNGFLQYPEACGEEYIPCFGKEYIIGGDLA